MSSTDRVRYSFIKEATLGAGPGASAAMKILRLTGESLKVMFQTDQSKELDPNRAEKELVQIGKSVAGDLNHELTWDAHEDLIAGAMAQLAWTGSTTKTLDNGSAMQGFSVLKEFQDLTAVNHLFKGLVVNTWNLTVPKKGIITGVFGLVGMDFANGAIGTLLTGSPTWAANSETDPMNSSSNLTSVLLDDVPFTSCMDNLTLSINNNVRPQECLGSLTPTGFTYGKFQLTGSADIYFKDETLFNKYKNATSFGFNFTLTDSNADTLSWDISRAKFEDMEIVAGGTNQDIIAKCKFRGLWDPTDTRVLRLTSVNT